MAPRILVVDDNPELLTLLTQLFENAGYSVAAASRGKQALELARTTPPEVAVLDILLPDMMGYHLADALRKERPEVPLIFVTGVFKGGKHALEARQKYGTAGYFEKPFEAQKLLEAVAALVPPGKKPAAAPSAQDAFEDVELEIDIVEEPQEAMELTGKIRVTGGGDVSAELR
ncbi:MAG TPA: response regulator, partial [Myxococcaceae bacterium]|nr:response regulator [Myxococcaceae bacterium]